MATSIFFYILVVKLNQLIIKIMAKDIKTLTNEDKTSLLLRGYTEEDFSQIGQGLKEVELDITDNDITKGCKTRKCGAKRAIEVIGREEFISGVARASFHATATRDSCDGRYKIFFDLRKWWR